METTSDLAAYAEIVPEPAELRRRLERLALLDAVLSGGSHPRHTFDAAWSPGVAVGRFDNGAGDDYAVVFAGARTLVRAFDHESSMSRYDEGITWPGLLEGMPSALEPFLTDPRINLEPSFASLTLALWWTDGDTSWGHGRLEPYGDTEPELTTWMLDLVEEWDLDAVYESFSYDLGGLSIAEGPFDALMADEPLTDAGVRELNPAADLGTVAAAAARIGRPLAS